MSRKTLKLVKKEIKQGPLDVMQIQTTDRTANIILEKGIIVNMNKSFDKREEKGCLTAGQRVYTGSGLKPIEEIEIGEEVLSHDGVFHKVRMKFKFKRPCFKVTFENGNEIICSANHKFLVDRDYPEKIDSWKEAYQCYPGLMISYLSKDNKIFMMHVIDVQEVGENEVYDITVEESHSYVTENRIINHNSL